MQYLTLANAALALAGLEVLGNFVTTLPSPTAKKIGNEIAVVTALIERLLAALVKQRAA